MDDVRGCHNEVVDLPMGVLLCAVPEYK